MKYITKNKEPESLINYRSTPNASFSDCNKNEIRNSLIKEQGDICAYCMQRIKNEPNKKTGINKTKIEHYKPQSIYNGKKRKKDLRLTYKNMLGVCEGNEDQPNHKSHCGVRKDDLLLSINPLDSNCEKLIKFKKDGRIFSENKEIDNDINNILNLNEETLKKNRKTTITFAFDSIKKRKKKKSSAINLELKKWIRLHADGYIPYCQAVIYFLNKKNNKHK